MIVLDCEQGSLDWIAARVGVATASQFHRIVTPARLQRSKSDYVYELAAEWLLGQPLEDEWKGNFWTDRGAAMEPEARAYFELHTGAAVRPVGFVYRDVDRDIGCSPDGLVHASEHDWYTNPIALESEPETTCTRCGVQPDDDAPMCDVIAGLELKCPSLKMHLAYWQAGAVPADYWLQVQGSMWVTGLERWWFMSYHPGVPQLCVEVERDEATHDALDAYVPAFLDELHFLRERLKAAGAQPMNEPA